MRVITGEFRGRPLKAPKGDATRPTTDRMKESMMSSLESLVDSVEGARVLDAFAGSGALGLELISRGALCAIFCERDRNALNALQDNIATLKLSSRRALVKRGDVFKMPLGALGPFNIVLLDPPYATDPQEIMSLLSRLNDSGALASDCVVMYEHGSKDDRVEDAISTSIFTTLRSRSHGETTVRFLGITDKTADMCESESCLDASVAVMATEARLDASLSDMCATEDDIDKKCV